MAAPPDWPELEERVRAYSEKVRIEMKALGKEGMITPVTIYHDVLAGIHEVLDAILPETPPDSPADIHPVPNTMREALSALVHCMCELWVTPMAFQLCSNAVRAGSLPSFPFPQPVTMIRNNDACDTNTVIAAAIAGVYCILNPALTLRGLPRTPDDVLAQAGAANSLGRRLVSGQDRARVDEDVMRLMGAVTYVGDSGAGIVSASAFDIVNARTRDFRAELSWMSDLPAYVAMGRSVGLVEAMEKNEQLRAHLVVGRPVPASIEDELYFISTPAYWSEKAAPILYYMAYTSTARARCREVVDDARKAHGIADDVLDCVFEVVCAKASETPMRTADQNRTLADRLVAATHMEPMAVYRLADDTTRPMIVLQRTLGPVAYSEVTSSLAGDLALDCPPRGVHGPTWTLLVIDNMLANIVSNYSFLSHSVLLPYLYEGAIDHLLQPVPTTVSPVAVAAFDGQWCAVQHEGRTLVDPPPPVLHMCGSVRDTRSLLTAFVIWADCIREPSVRSAVVGVFGLVFDE